MFLGRRACFAGLACVLAAFSQTQAQTGTALVRHAPTLNGRVEGSIQVMSPESITLGTGASVTGILLLPGNPAVALGADAILGEELAGPGATTPIAHGVTLAAGSQLGRLVKRVDGVVWPALSPVPAPTGTQAITMGAPSPYPANFSVVRILAYIGTTGEVAVPPGNYGNFVATRAGGGFVLGRVGDTEPAYYSFQALALDGGSSLRVVGPVIVRVGSGRFTGDVGEPAHPEWLQLQLGSAWTIATGKKVYAEVIMPTATLSLGAGSTFVGRVQTDQLSVGSGAVLRLTEPHPAPPLTAGFESVEGYTLGALHGQSGWLAGSGVTTTQADAASGQRAVLLPGANPPLSLLRLFDAPASSSVVFADLFILPHAAADAATSAELSLHNIARLRFVRAGEQGRFMYLAGDGSGGGEWRQSPAGMPLDAHGFAADWLRVTLRLDYAAKEWDLYVNGTMAAAAVGFTQASQANLTALSLSGQTSAPTLLDDVLVAFDNPLFLDADRDGMDDAWEVAKGLNPALNDRAADADADGLNNLREFALGTHPSEPDTDQDGMTDGWEQFYGLSPVSHDAMEDFDQDGVSNLHEFLQGRNPTKAAVKDTNGSVNLRIYAPSN